MNGITTGEWCGAVTATNTDFWYAVNGINVWARHMQGASSPGNTCPTFGDSGAPVYRKQWAAAVAAVGIYSGGVPEVLACDAYFTDIWDAFDGLPGTLKVQ